MSTLGPMSLAQGIAGLLAHLMLQDLLDGKRRRRAGKGGAGKRGGGATSLGSGGPGGEGNVRTIGRGFGMRQQSKGRLCHIVLSKCGRGILAPQTVLTTYETLATGIHVNG